MLRCRSAVLSTLLLICTLACLAPAAAEQPAETTEAGREAESAEGREGETETNRLARDGEPELRIGPLEEGVVVVIEADDLGALGQVLDPWEVDGIVVHGPGAGDEKIRNHVGSDKAEITTHTGTSGDRSRIPTIGMGTSHDADIVVHGSGGRGPSRIKVHGHGR